MPLQERKIMGDATEIGLLRFACKYVDVPHEQELHPKVFEIPFNSQNKWHLTVHAHEEDGNHYSAYVKGAPERIARMCSAIKINDEVRRVSV